MEKLNSPSLISSEIAAQGDKNIILEVGVENTGRASIKEGFPPITSLPKKQGGIAPSREDFNGLFNLLSQHNVFAQNGGSYTFNSKVAETIGGYPKDAILWYIKEAGIQILRSTVENNKDNFIENPSVIGTTWVETLANASLDNLSSVGKEKVVAPGTIVAYPKDNLAGYHICRGGTVNRTTYSELFDVIGTIYGAGDGLTTFTLPDFRACFLRGYGFSSAAIGVQQSHALATHTHNYQMRAILQRQIIFNTQTAFSDYAVTATSNHQTGVPEGTNNANETRPINHAINWFIKY